LRIRKAARLSFDRQRWCAIALLCAGACGGSAEPSAASGAGSDAGTGHAVAGQAAVHSGAGGLGADAAASSNTRSNGGAQAMASTGVAGGAGAATSGGAAASGGTAAAMGGATAIGGSTAGAAAATGGSSSADGGSKGSGGTPAAMSGQALYMDSFEDATSLDTSRYEIVTPNCSGTGMVALDTSIGHDSMHSLRVDGGAGFCNHVFARLSKLGAMLPNPLYVRVFVKVSTPLGAGHTTFAAMHDMQDDKDLRLGGQNQVLIWNRESDDATLPELSPTGVGMSAALAADNWQCLEWAIDSQARTLRTWLDGKPLAGLTLDADPTPDVDRQWLRKTDWQPHLIDVRLGWESYGDQTETMWFDDLAVATSQLGCVP
jgi:hypothetical protein